MPEKLFFAVSAFSLDTLLLCSRQNFPLYFVMGSFPPATALHFQNFFKSYLLHSLQVAITTGKSKKHGAIDWTCQMDFKCSRLTRLCQHFWSNVPSPFVAGGYRVLLHSLQVAIESNKMWVIPNAWIMAASLVRASTDRLCWKKLDAKCQQHPVFPGGLPSKY